MSLNPCHVCGTHPVEQSRGQMTPEDHHMQYARYGAVKQLAENHGLLLDVNEFRRDAFEVENQGSEHASDMRISCPNCGNATGWDRRDIEEWRDSGGGPGHQIRIPKVPHGNVENIRKRWNDANPA